MTQDAAAIAAQGLLAQMQSSPPAAGWHAVMRDAVLWNGYFVETSRQVFSRPYVSMLLTAQEQAEAMRLAHETVVREYRRQFAGRLS
ncbi:hypothetical protein [Roseicella sp. DB1501]|uniref:hypothetical protein n=1 Tax=Roseicella sp. DB1501 TaxID=2730925 RepID=UPI001491039D|nr:hypothetical protein [Roseicella sp. DB1501]NOG69828.1 hypothetical protein [Roseicella sp. DB1501]